MTIRDDLEAFFLGDVPTAVVALVTLATGANGDIYVGQRERINPSDFEVRIRYVRRDVVRHDTGQARHHMELHVSSIGWDASQEDNLADLVEDVAELIVTTYNGARDVLATGVSGATVYRVRSFRAPPLDLSNFRRRSAVVTVQVDEMEA
jgi:hypothetical protein